MTIKTTQKRIKGVLLAGTLGAGTMLAGTGCDLENEINPAAKGVLDITAPFTADGADEYSFTVDNVKRVRGGTFDPNTAKAAKKKATRR